MLIFDAHCDTLTRAVNEGKNLSANSLHWDVARAGQYDGFVQVLAIWQDPDKVKPSFEGAMRYILAAEKFQREAPRLKLCRNASELEGGLQEKKVCAFLAVEGGECLEGEIENLRLFYQAGVRVLTLTWNHANGLGDGADEPENRGLTPFGREVMQWMQQNGMVVDISHAGERAFYDCIDIARKPIIASHSNARRIHDHPRNLRDEQLLAIAKTGGVIGMNFYTKFIGPPGKADLTALIGHIEHILGIAGEDSLGLGADFDGMYSLPPPIVGVENLYSLFNTLARMNYSDEILEKIASGNFLRVFGNALEQTGNNMDKPVQASEND
ncbi:MAG: membrane dipeptidase [Ruminiclostridium sp.]|nr:membrane dipeptidase [Ruminiclostridium sp.]